MLAPTGDLTEVGEKVMRVRYFTFLANANFAHLQGISLSGQRSQWLILLSILIRSTQVVRNNVLVLRA